ncbi:O-acetyltransferase [Bordetella sp. N]|nr:O-acetyltransferase [Bordetella sp. N]
MRTGAMYDDLTPELLQARQQAVLLTDRYNRSFGQAPAEREAILHELFQRIGKGVHFEPTLRCEFGFNVVIGDRFYANFDCVLLDGGGITFGDDVLLGPKVGIYTSNHALDPHERAAGGCYAKPVHIGNRVWIGGAVQVMQGVTIGDNSVIGAGSVVTRDIPPNVLAAGVPCRVLREITEADRTGFR